MVITEDRLSDVLSEFARTLVTDFPIQGILDHLVLRIVDILPIEAAGVSLISPTTHPRFVAGSDESAVRYEHLQTALGEGPCIAAFETDEPISIPDLVDDDRFPRFTENALDEGLMAVFTFPLRHGDRCLGALDLYRTTAGPLDEPEMAAAQTLADVATAYLLNAQARQAKTEFVATVSHELRTPMTSITGFIELLEDDDGLTLTEDQKGFVDAIRRNSDRLTELANELLTLSSLESGTFSNQRTDVDLRQVVLTAHKVLEPAIAARHLEVTFEVPPGPVMVHGDVQSLESLVSNLVSNALKFTEDSGWVRCRLRMVAGNARLEVSDNGLGIPEDEQADLFTRFFRSTTAQEHAIQGSGLGLTIVDSIVKGHGGEIAVVSEHMVGSTFTVNLPLANASSHGSANPNSPSAPPAAKGRRLPIPRRPAARPPG
jgi:signal transduction histidine kinase